MTKNRPAENAIRNTSPMGIPTSIFVLSGGLCGAGAAGACEAEGEAEGVGGSIREMTGPARFV